MRSVPIFPYYTVGAIKFAGLCAKTFGKRIEDPLNSITDDWIYNYNKQFKKLTIKWNPVAQLATKLFEGRVCSNEEHEFNSPQLIFCWKAPPLIASPLVQNRWYGFHILCQETWAVRPTGKSLRGRLTGSF